MARKNKNQKQGPSITSKVDEKQQEWHTTTSDDEESYASEIDKLYKD